MLPFVFGKMLVLQKVLINCGQTKGNILWRKYTLSGFIYGSRSGQQRMISNQSETMDRSYAQTSTDPSHIPVMSSEVLRFLNPKPGQVFLDMTFGGGGHTRKILDNAPGCHVIALDRDPLAYQMAVALQDQYPGRITPLLGRFSELPELLREQQMGKESIDGILMDVGVSSMQFDMADRGFMLSKDGPLDMRMDGNRFPDQLNAADILRHIDEVSLYKVLKYYGNEKHARKIAQAVIESRYLLKSLRTTKELAEFVASVTGASMKLDKLERYSHPATKTFQALRMLVNNELNELDYGLQIVHYYLRHLGLLVAISFHSLEDTIIKRHLTGMKMDETPKTIGLGVGKHRHSLAPYTKKEMDTMMERHWMLATKHVVLPSEEEVRNNPRARSAKLRAAAKI